MFHYSPLPNYRYHDESESCRGRHGNTVLVESECTDFPLPQLLDLRKFVDRANEWVDSADTFIIRKHSLSLLQSFINYLPVFHTPGDKPCPL
jgi:hypothetical protein